MEPIVWCHCSDAHLGYKQYNLAQRLRDYGSAFNECITQIIEQNPNFVLFSGDLFEHYNPNPPELRQAIAILNKLKNPNGDGKSIPIFVISGNHDVSYSASKRYGGDILDFLQDLDLIHYLKDKIELVEKDGKPIALIAGLRYYGKRTPRKLKEFLDKEKELLERTDIPKILLLHAFVEGTVAKHDISTYGLATYGFDYIATGHYHLRWPSDFSDEKNKIFSAGATEHRTSVEWGHERGFITVSTERDGEDWKIKPKFTSYPVREKDIILHNFGITTADEVIKVTNNLIQQNDENDKLVKLILKGNLKKGEFTFLNLHEMKGKAKNVLYFDITNHITATAAGITAPKSDREAYLEVLKNSFNVDAEHMDNYVALIENIVKIVNDRDFSELNEKILEDFVTKTPEAIKSPTVVQKEPKPVKKKSKKRVKKQRKAKSTKKLNAFKKKEE